MKKTLKHLTGGLTKKEYCRIKRFVEEFTGQFFYDLFNDDLYVYDGAAWQAVTITSGEIVYAGNYNASTNKVSALTASGTAAGFAVGSALAAAAQSNLRYYFVVDTSGTGSAPAPTSQLDPPDMLLSNGTSWEKLDISNFICFSTFFWYV